MSTTLRTLRVFEGEWIDEGYEFIGVGEANGWKAVAGWGRDGWDMGDWPYVVVLRRGLSRATYVEGDIEVETFESEAELVASLDATALFYWRSQGAEWIAGIEPGQEPDYLRGPYSSTRP